MSTKMKHQDEFLNHLLDLAYNKRISAGMSGSMGDGGASVIINEVAIYQAALKNSVPACWEIEYNKNFINQFDPEYAEYLRLKDKFKNELP